MTMRTSKQGSWNVVAVLSSRRVVFVAAAALVLGATVVLRAQTAQWQLLLPASVPTNGTFASMQLSNYPPLPWNPYPQLNVYWWSNTPDILWVDDLQVDYSTPVQEQQAARGMLRMDDQSGMDSTNDLPPLPGGWGGDGGGGDSGPWLGGPVTVYPAGSLLLSIAQITNGWVPLTITNTMSDTLYEIESEQALTNSAWAWECSVMGAANQNWTATAVPEGDRTNMLFFRAESLGSSDSYGVPWAWYVQNGFTSLTPGLGGQDANGDGLPNWQEYLWGSNPQAQNGFSVWVGSPSGALGIP
jgi:hypothetical protein